MGCELIGSISIGIEMENPLGEGAACVQRDQGQAGVAADTSLTHEELPETTSWI